MNIGEVIKREINSFLKENIEYRGEHGAPSLNDSPMHDLTDTYPDDIYSYDAPRLYAHYHDNNDNQAISIIQAAKNKPNKPVKIYRAVPDINYEINSKLKPLIEIINYYNQWERFPLKNNIIHNLQDKYNIDNYTYEEQQKLILDDVYSQINELKNKLKKQININNGDWVTINLKYAKVHGESNLNNKYKIISKTVPAKHLFTDGNNIFEWGYNIHE
jgi:translation initiation factor IF-1